MSDRPWDTLQDLHERRAELLVQVACLRDDEVVDLLLGLVRQRELARAELALLRLLHPLTSQPEPVTRREEPSA